MRTGGGERERFPSRSTVGGDLGERRVAQRFPVFADTECEDSTRDHMDGHLVDAEGQLPDRIRQAGDAVVGGGRGLLGRLPGALQTHRRPAGLLPRATALSAARAAAPETHRRPRAAWMGWSGAHAVAHVVQLAQDPRLAQWVTTAGHPSRNAPNDSRVDVAIPLTTRHASCLPGRCEMATGGSWEAAGGLTCRNSLQGTSHSCRYLVRRHGWESP